MIENKRDSSDCVLLEQQTFFHSFCAEVPRVLVLSLPRAVHNFTLSLKFKTLIENSSIFFSVSKLQAFNFPEFQVLSQ